MIIDIISVVIILVLQKIQVHLSVNRLLVNALECVLKMNLQLMSVGGTPRQEKMFINVIGKRVALLR